MSRRQPNRWRSCVTLSALPLVTEFRRASPQPSHKAKQPDATRSPAHWQQTTGPPCHHACFVHIPVSAALTTLSVIHVASSLSFSPSIPRPSLPRQLYLPPIYQATLLSLQTPQPLGPHTPFPLPSTYALTSPRRVRSRLAQDTHRRAARTCQRLTVACLTCSRNTPFSSSRSSLQTAASMPAWMNVHVHDCTEMCSVHKRAGIYAMSRRQPNRWRSCVT